MSDERYRDPSRPIEQRTNDLLARMSLEEKVAQLAGLWSFRLFEDGAYSPSRAEEVLANGIGQIARPAGGSGYGAEESARLANAIQKFLIEETRLGIPALMHDECLSGFLMKGSTLFPQAIGLASTWDPGAVERMTEVLRRQMRAVGVHQGLAPVLDVARDPRWGRVEETFGEDPYLVGSMGVAYVRGLQGEEPAEGVVATVKHFAGYGASEGGMNMAPAHVPERELREVYLFPFECAVRAAGAMSVMNSYGEIDGIPCAMSHKLLTEILRDEWGFEGVVVADYGTILRLVEHHRVAPDREGAAARCLEAGLDLELPDPDCYAAPLIAAVRGGRVPEAAVDRSVLRVLRTKFRLGLFERPYVDVERSKAAQLPRHRETALELARESIVLLKNDGVLPLDAETVRIALIGPTADAPRNLLGDYAYPAHMELMFATLAEGSIRPPVDLDEIVASVEVTSVLAAVTQYVDDGRLVHARGCDVTGDRRDGFDEAIEAARTCDVAVVVVGDRSGLTVECTSGETRDLANLKLPGVQEELVLAVAETGTPVVLVLASGRPYALTRLVDRVAAIVAIWLPGETGGEALAEALFGVANPGGKLPVTFPRSAGQIPIYYAHKPSGGHTEWWGDYVDERSAPLFPFGHGLSYTTFDYSNLAVDVRGAAEDGAVRVALDVRNAGDRAGDEVVQLYVKREHASVTRPVQELKGFRRIRLRPGGARRVAFDVPFDALAFYDPGMRRVVEPGEYEVLVGGSAADVRLRGRFEIAGETHVLSGPRKYFSAASVEE
jgi:beta-glucosidase